MKKILITIAALGICVVALVVGGLMYIGTVGPETYVVAGRQMTKLQVDTIHKLGLLDDEERIQFFYSDALADIRNGMYFVTDRKLVLYNKNWQEPELIATYKDIANAEIERDESFFLDSTITIHLDTEEVWTFPVSSEGGSDKTFFDYLASKIDALGEQE